MSSTNSLAGKGLNACVLIFTINQCIMVERLVAISSMCYVVIEMVVELKGASLLKTLCLVLLKNNFSSYPPTSLPICFLYQSLS